MSQQDWRYDAGDPGPLPGWLKFLGFVILATIVVAIFKRLWLF